MKEKISRTLAKISSDTPKASSPNSSSATKNILGDPNCPHCHGAGYIRNDVPLGDPHFGRLEPCVCRSTDIADGARQRLFELSRLDRLSHLTFENFEMRGNKNAKFMTPQDALSLQTAKEKAENFARTPQGWLLLEGGYGCGKTHIAAAIANYAVSMGTPTLFITVPDLLDSLRFAFSDPETTFEARFEEIRNAALLVLDDFGTQNATAWAQEKLFQIINYRYINKLPTVITTNLMLDEIESRIRSRLQDEEFVAHVRIIAPDYRRPTETSNPGISMLSSPELKEKTFANFHSRKNEENKTDTVITVSERTDNFGNKIKEKQITRQTITKEDIESLDHASEIAYTFATDPQGWLVLIGQTYSGKTHLAAAIGNYRIKIGSQATLVTVSDLLDYLKQTFDDNSDVSFNRRFYEVRNTPLLILDDLRESGLTSNWATDKLTQILNYRYNMHLPTVITSTMRSEEFFLNYPGLWEKILDTDKCQVCVIDMPPYRRIAKASKSPVVSKKAK
jgi:DNA replication protein DnaC